MNRKLASTLTEDKLQLLLDNEAVFAMIYNDQISYQKVLAIYRYQNAIETCYPITTIFRGVEIYRLMKASTSEKCFECLLFLALLAREGCTRYLPDYKNTKA